MEEEILSETRERMEKVLEFLRGELAVIRVGRPSPSLVENILVEAYETKLRVLELATILIQEPNQILIKPFDPSNLENIRKAILKANLGLNPVIDEEVIRITIPPLTGEQREAMVKVVGQKMEGARIMVRQIRAEIMKKIERSFEESKISEDEKFRLRKKVQEIVEEFNKRIEEISEAKKKELRGE